MTVTDLHCACGKLHMEVREAPIIVAECYCNSCREGARRLEALPGAPKVAGSQGGSHYVLYRKDRVRIVAGKEGLRNFRLGPQSHTRRVFATCCNTPVLTEFQGGHWVSLYGNLWPAGTLPQPDLRTQTGDLPPGTALDGGVPSGGWETTKFYGRLLGAWVAMGFRSPALALDTAEVELR